MIQSILFSNFFYLVMLLLSISGLLIADWRLKLVFFNNFSAAWKSIVIMILLLLAADIVGIKLNLFFTNQNYVTGINLGSKNLPIEEIFFLFLLSYVTLVLYQIISHLPFFVDPDEVEGSDHISRQTRNDRKNKAAK